MLHIHSPREGQKAAPSYVPLNNLNPAQLKKITYEINNIKIAFESQTTSNILFQASQRDQVYRMKSRGRINSDKYTDLSHIKLIRISKSEIPVKI